MDLDKKLTEIKTIIPTVSNHLFEKIFITYQSNNIKREVKRIPSKRNTLVFSIMVLFIACVLSISLILSNNHKSELLYKDAKLLTEVVYNTTVKKNEDYQLIKESKNKRFSNNFHYSSLTVHRSYGFEITLDFVMTPYFDNYVIGDKVDVIIAMINLHGDQNQTNSVAQDMIIFCYQNQIYGFLSPTYGVVNPLNPRNEKELDFGTYMFLTRDAVVKYYERGDYVYDFELVEFENHKINLSATQTKAFDYEFGENQYNIKILDDSYVELNSGDVVDLLNLSLVETVEIEAIITSVDVASGKIYLICDSIPSLQSVTFSISIIDEHGYHYQINDLKKGDKIQLYYYKRYNNYAPVNIKVENIILK